MDYQKACGCRMGRAYAPPVYRTMQMNNAHLKSCEQRDHPTAYQGERVHQMQQGVRMGVVRSEQSPNCCGDPNQHSPSLAIVTSPDHVWQKLYTPCDAMAHGTLFCELYKPMVGCRTGGRMR